MSLTEREAILALAVLVIAGTLAAAWCIWQQGKDIRWLWGENERLRDDVDALWGRIEPAPEADAETTELPAWTPPQSTVTERLRYIGGHRA